MPYHGHAQVAIFVRSAEYVGYAVPLSWMSQVTLAFLGGELYVERDAKIGFRGALLASVTRESCC